MPISKDEAQSLCSKTEWNTLENSHSPKLESLSGSVAKKQANRVRRFLSKEEGGDADKKRISMFKEALERLEALIPAKEDNAKLEARREKEKAARDRVKALKDKRTDVKEKLLKKAEEEAEAEGADDDVKTDKTSGKQSRSGQKKSGKFSQGKIGSRKV